MEFQIENLRYIGAFPQPIVFKTERLLKRCRIYRRRKSSQLWSMLNYYTPWKHQKAKSFYMSRELKREY